ncbi:MAG: hypothetical protein AAGC93_29085 [Cyanobacteria bacterium P01_F01_bin.53]
MATYGITTEVVPTVREIRQFPMVLNFGGTFKKHEHIDFPPQAVNGPAKATAYGLCLVKPAGRCL